MGLGLVEAAALGLWVQVQFLPLRLPLRGFQREWPEESTGEPTGETRHSPSTQHLAPCLWELTLDMSRTEPSLPLSLNSSLLLALRVQTALPQPPPLAWPAWRISSCSLASVTL